MHDDPSDGALLQRWREGDAAAGACLIERHVGTLFRFFANKVDVVDDFAQAVLQSCLEARDRIDPSRSFRAYLLGIARHHLMRHYREQLRGRRAARLEKACADDIVVTPSRALALRRDRRMLLDALRKLPIELQLVFELYYWEGLTTAEIADVVEASDVAVRARLSRGRAALRQILEAQGPGAFDRSTATTFEDWARSLQQLGEEE